MADREPRRRKKRKDTQRKDDVHSEDQLFMPTRSESKDSDPEVEEEIPVPSHQPSGFAKVVFLVLFSGLVVSMSFIFISLHGAERGAVDLFDDHHSEEHHVSLDSHDQIENGSSIAEHQEDSESWSPDLDSHDETESWSSSDFLPGNIMDMLPDIGNILAFNSEQSKESDSLVSKDENTIESSETLERMEVESEQTPEDTTDDSEEENESIFDIKENTKHSDEVLEERISPETHSNLASSLNSDEEDLEENLFEKEPVTESSVDHRTQTEEPVYEYNDLDFTTPEDISSSEPSLDLFSDVIPEVEPERVSTTEDSFSSSDQDLKEEELKTRENSFVTTSDYEEDDRLLYEKAFVTNEADYEIREELDQLEKVLEKNLPSDETEGDDDDDDDDENDEEIDEFDFWQF